MQPDKTRYYFFHNNEFLMLKVELLHNNQMYIAAVNNLSYIEQNTRGKSEW